MFKCSLKLVVWKVWKIKERNDQKKAPEKVEEDGIQSVDGEIQTEGQTSIAIYCNNGILLTTEK